MLLGRRELLALTAATATDDALIFSAKLLELDPGPAKRQSLMRAYLELGRTSGFRIPGLTRLRLVREAAPPRSSSASTTRWSWRQTWPRLAEVDRESVSLDPAAVAGGIRNTGTFRVQ
jgi:hypothetical protein